MGYSCLANPVELIEATGLLSFRIKALGNPGPTWRMGRCPSSTAPGFINATLPLITYKRLERGLKCLFSWLH